MKIKAVLILLSTILLLCSCTQFQNDVDQSTDQIIAKEDFELLGLPSNCNILLFEGRRIIYTIEKTSPDNPEDTTATLYTFDLDNNMTSELTTVKFPDPSVDSAVIHKNNLYLPCVSTNNKNMLAEINLDTGVLNTIKEWDDDTLFSYVYIAPNECLVLFRINLINGGGANGGSTEYVVESINLSDFTAETIIKEIWTKESVTSMPAIFVDSDCIYTYQSNGKGNSLTRTIAKYDHEGNPIEQSILKIKDFLEWVDGEENEIENDSFIEIYKEGKYFVIPTLNRRICLLRQNDDGILERIPTPDAMYKPFPGHCDYLKHSGANNGTIYFVDATKTIDVLYVFNCRSEKFTAIKLPYGGENILTHYDRNEEGDIVAMQLNIDLNKRYYHYLDVEALMNYDD